MVKRVGDQRARARAAPRPDGNALRLRPFDEVGDDEEIAGKLHPHDDAELEFEPLAVVLDRVARRAAVERDQPLQALARLAAQFLLFVDRRAVGGGKMRQDRLARQRTIGAAHRDLDAVVGRLLQIGEQRQHFGARLEAMLRRQAAPLRGGDERAFGDAEQRVLGLEIGPAGEIGFVGGDERQPLRVGKIDKGRLDSAFALQAVALDLDVEAAVEARGEAHQARRGDVVKAQRQRAVDRPRRPAGERDEAAATRRARQSRYAARRRPWGRARRARRAASARDSPPRSAR